MKKDWSALLDRTKLFSGVDKTDLTALLESARAYRESFKPGEEIFLEKDGAMRIGILLSGRIKVYSARENGALLNEFSAGSVCGVARLYAEGEKVTSHLFSAGKSSVLFFDEAYLDLLWEHPKVRKNLIGFLADRIRFLNRKIASFTAPGAKEKVAMRLIEGANDDVFVIRSGADLARELNLGRASLYRVLDAFEKEGAIRREKKTVFLLDSSRLRETK